MHKSECLLRLIPSVCPAEDGERWCMTALDGTAVSDSCPRVHCLCCIDRDGIVVPDLRNKDTIETDSAASICIDIDSSVGCAFIGAAGC